MRSKFLPAILAAAILFGSPAFATTTEGVVQAIDMEELTLTTDDGTIYNLPENFEDEGLVQGTKVTIEWEVEDDEGTLLRQVSSIIINN